MRQLVAQELRGFSIGTSGIWQLPETFEPEHPEPDQAVDEGTDRGAVYEDDEHTDKPPNVTK